MRRETLYNSTKLIMNNLQETGIATFISNAVDNYRHGANKKEDELFKDKLSIFKNTQ